jgi:aspartate/methionine/tyrosine aminotransferase
MASPSISPFARLNEKLAGIPPGLPPIDLGVGEPQMKVPTFVGEVLQRSLADFGRYPPIRGTDSFRAAVAGWLGRRYRLSTPIDPETMVLPLNGSREGLFFAALGAREFLGKERPVVLLPNPYYQAYAAGAEAAGAELVPLDCGPGQGFLPDPLQLDGATLDRAIAFYVASPSNPEGAVASAERWREWVDLARRHDFMLFADECYGELYRETPPPGALEAAGGGAGACANVVSFNSLSKRSGMPGLRVGFAAGDPAFIKSWTRLRNMAGPQVPLPIQAVAVAAYQDEAHVTEGRALYNARYAAAERILGRRFGHLTPPGGLFLWLNCSAEGGGESAAIRLWREAGVRTVPGAYFAQQHLDGSNPAADYLRVALVKDLPVIEEALTRMTRVFP